MKESINTLLEERSFFSGFDDTTYFRPELFTFFVNNIDDPDVLFKIKILGRYKPLYKWTDEQCWEFINKNISDSRGHSVNGVWYAYDWGCGENKITKDKMHEPNLDHIIPRERGGSNDPSNMRIRCRRLNENKGNTNTDQERFATIMDMLNDFDDDELRRSLITDLYAKYCDE